MTNNLFQGVVLIFRIANLLDFYARTLAKMIGERATLTETLVEYPTSVLFFFFFSSLTILRGKHEALKAFYDILKEQGDKLQRNPPNPPSALVPPPAIYDSINRMVRNHLYKRV
jgi:hypothetical protein